MIGAVVVVGLLNGVARMWKTKMALQTSREELLCILLGFSAFWRSMRWMWIVLVGDVALYKLYQVPYTNTQGFDFWWWTSCNSRIFLCSLTSRNKYKYTRYPRYPSHSSIAVRSGMNSTVFENYFSLFVWIDMRNSKWPQQNRDALSAITNKCEFCENWQKTTIVHYCSVHVHGEDNVIFKIPALW